MTRCLIISASRCTVTLITLLPITWRVRFQWSRIIQLSIPRPVTTFRHLITIDWDPAAKKLSVFIDGGLVLSTVNDLVQTVFSGDPIVYWGFSGSNTQLTWYPANSDIDWGRLYFYFGQILTRIDSRPEMDSCFAGPIQFIDSSIYSSGNGTDPLSFVKWYWDFGDGSVSTDRNPPPHQYPAPGSYTVKFAITNSSGCAYDTLVKKITLGSPPKPDFTASPLCTNTDIHFTDKSRADVGIPVAWTWQFDNGMMSIDKDPGHSIFYHGSSYCIINGANRICLQSRYNYHTCDRGKATG